MIKPHSQLCRLNNNVCGTGKSLNEWKYLVLGEESWEFTHKDCGTNFLGGILAIGVSLNVIFFNY